MVYCGKPSKGCSSCRERKIRCDQRDPGCGQCEKRNLQCPGYRNLVDLMFRDESSHVIKKAKKARVKGTTHTSATTARGGAHATATTPLIHENTRHYSADRQMISRPSSPGSLRFAQLRSTGPHHPSQLGNAWPPSSDDLDQNQDGPFIGIISGVSPEKGYWPRKPTEGSLPYDLAAALEQQGVAYFFAQYVTADEVANMQPFDFIFEIWRPGRSLTERQNDSVMAAMAAVGLAGLSRLKACNHLLAWSRRSYGTALRLTNDALRRASDVVKDTTLLSVLILSLYELLTGHDPQAARAWQDHVNGASILAKMRGTGQFSSRAGISMFNALRHTILINCVQHQLPLPTALAQLGTELESVLSFMGEGPGWRLSGPICSILQLRHDVSQGLQGSPDHVIAQLLTTDRKLSDMAAASINDHQEGYRLVRVSQGNSTAFGDHCHIYSSPAQATAWNNMRCIRMLLHETIIQQILPERPHGNREIPPDHRLVLARSVKLLEKLRAAILATVPQHLGSITSKDVGCGVTTNSNSALETLDVRSPPIHLGVTARPKSTPPASPSSTISFWSASRTFLALPIQPPSQAGMDGEAVEQIMTLVSASNTLVWSLYVVGVSRLCTKNEKEYVVARLMDVYRDFGVPQARIVASLVSRQAISPPLTVTDVLGEDGLKSACSEDII